MFKVKQPSMFESGEKEMAHAINSRYVLLVQQDSTF